MSNLSKIGKLIHLYMDEIEAGDGTNAPDFLISSTAKFMNETGGRNWIPVIVKEVGEDQYQVIGNSFIFAVAEAAALEKVWCIIADESEETEKISKILSGEKIPQINLSTATRDEIKAAIQYLIEKPDSQLKRVKLPVVTNRIDEAPRQYWKDFKPITKLGCGITTAKVNALKEVFYLTPQPIPEPEKVNLSIATKDEIKAALQYLIEKPDSKLKQVDLEKATNCIDEAPRLYWKDFKPITKLGCGITKAKVNLLKEVFYLTPELISEIITDRNVLNSMTVTELKKMAKKQEIPGYTKKKKEELVELLSAIN
ncbi:Rho termination factor N-terminal domain-containing protein [Dapis sp. BLCC M126]|uniref:Rho termination factor N-terminal domain-containing protein n=1 Tax=Dapis sp. BLCC M126 TaxID=3400189 RepID=UPI003CEB4812